MNKTTGGDICTAASGNTCGGGAGGSAPGAINRPFALAFDAAGDFWVGDEGRIERFGPGGEFLSTLSLPSNGLVGSLAIDTDPASPSFEDFYALSDAVDEVQRTAPPATGTYTLTFVGATTGPIRGSSECGAAGACNSEVQAALEALFTVGAGNVFVNSAGTTIEFAGALGHQDVPQLEISAGSVSTEVQGGPEELLKLKPSGEPIEALDAAAPFGHPRALGLDPASGELFVSDQAKPEEEPGTATLLSYEPSGALVQAFAGGQVIGKPSDNSLAYGTAAASLYVASHASEESSVVQAFVVPPPGPLPLEGTSRAKAVRKTTATLCAEVDPEGRVTTARFQYLTEAQFQKNEAEGHEGFAGAAETPSSAPLGSDFSPHEICLALTGLTTATAYRFRVLATNAVATNPGEAAAFQTEPSAAIDSTSAARVTAESATLEAEINPLGDATSYRFEYLTEEALKRNEEAGEPPFVGAAQAPLEPAPLGSGEADLAVSQHLQGLQPNTVYRYRVVAFNALAPAGLPGPTLAFTTQPAVSAPLPDHRAWELVSPADKHGALLTTELLGGFDLQAAASGDAATYNARNPTEAEPSGYRQTVQVVSFRGSAGWSSRDIAPRHTGATGFGFGTEFPLFSADLTAAILNPYSGFEPSLSPEATEQTPYVRSNFSGSLPAFCGEACYRPILTGAAGIADVPPGTHFSTAGKCPPNGNATCGPRFLAATPDLSHVIVESRVALTSTPLPAGSTGQERTGLYEWSAAAPPDESLRLIGVGPAGEPLAGQFQVAGLEEETRASAISANGSSIVFFDFITEQLYLRINATEEQSKVSGGALDGSQCTEPARACTIQLDAVQGGSGAGNAQPHFQLASADGSRVFFTDTQRLTPGSGAGPGVKEYDLYEFDLHRTAGQRLADLTPIVGGEAAEVQDAVIGGSPDGSSLYFVAQSVLTGAEQNERGETAKPGDCRTPSGNNPASGTCNLYLDRDGTVRFIAVLSGTDAPSWGEGFGGGEVTHMSSRVSPDGRWLAFMSSRPLTGYDNRDARTGKRDEEIFLYDSAANGSQGRLLCVSCNPTGARPDGWLMDETNQRLNESQEIGTNNAWHPGASLAALIPSWPRPNYRSRALSNSGRLFFEAYDSLAPQATNGSWDVYEFEPPPGAQPEPPEDTCSESSPSYSADAAGCIDLISSGTSPQNSIFIDASESGSDVFFYTNASLDPARDLDTARDVYDARSPRPRRSGRLPRPRQAAPLRRRRLPEPGCRARRPYSRFAHLPGPRRPRSGARATREKDDHQEDGQMQEGIHQETQQVRENQEEENEGKEVKPEG